jgi:hypothetical protein
VDLLDKIHRAERFGPEFLTWLWYRAEEGDGVFGFDPEFGEFEVYFEEHLVVGSEDVNAQENFFKGGQPSMSLEARTALRLGKLANVAKLRIIRGAQEWSFVLKARPFGVSGVKIPAVLSRESDEKFGERMLLLEQLDTMVKGLLKQFLQLRVSDAWRTDELPAIRKWIAGSE